MNVTTTSAPVGKPLNTTTAYKPLTENWRVEGQSDSFKSTADLVAQGESINGKKATYFYTSQAQGAPFTRGEKFANAVGSGLQGAAAGAGIGAMVGAGLAFMVTAGDLLSLAMGGRMAGASSAVVTVPVLLGAAVGGALTGSAGYRADLPPVGGGTVTGTLQARDGKVLFYPGGQVDKEVNLSEFQSASEAPLVRPEAVPTSVLGDTFKGALAGAAIVPAILIPLAGLGAGGFLGYQAGATLDQRTQLGRGLGLTLGLAATGATIAIGQMSSGRLEAMGSLAGGLAVAGGLLGHKVFNAQAQQPDYHDYGVQWWNRNEGS